MESLLRDFRFAVRSLAKSPLFVGVATLTLGLGLGVNATIFTFVNAIVLKPLPIEKPQEVLAVYSTWEGEAYASSSYADFKDLAEQNDVFESFIGHGSAIASLQHDGRSDIVVGELVTGEYFRMLGVEPVAGRALGPADEDPSQPRAVVLGHGLWQRRFGANPNIVGQQARLNGTPYEIVGVAPADFPGLFPGLAADYFVPAVWVGDIDAAGQINAVHNDPGTTALDRRGYRWMWMKGRLKPGVEPDAAEAQLQTIMARLAQEHPITNEDRTAVALPASEVRVHPNVDKVLGPAAAVLLGAVSLVLLIVCANLANMLLSRAQSRQREIAVRLALGANRVRLLRQLITESLVLATLGGTAAILFAFWTSRLLLAYQPPIPFSLNWDVAIDGRVILFTALLALGSTLLFALVPAMRASRPDLVPSLKAGGHGASAGTPTFFSLRNVLVMAQVAVSLVLLVAGSLFARGLSKAGSIDVGLQPERVAAVILNLSMNGYEREEGHQFMLQLRDRVAAMPGVESAGLAARVPFDSNDHFTTVFPDTMAPSDDRDGFAVAVTWVDENYFKTIDVPMVAGRPFLATDQAGAPRVAIVNEAMAERLWQKRDVVGERLYRGGLDTEPFTVVGVLKDHKVKTVGEDPTPFAHFALRQAPRGHAFIVARSIQGDATPIAVAIEAAAREMDPNLAFGDTTTLARMMGVSLYPVRMGATLLGLFGVLALVLASLGLYGVIAYSVSCRSREIGVRIAMGARPRDVLGLVLRGGMGLVALGVMAGVALAAGGSRFLTAVLYGVSALDPVAYGAAVLVLFGVALAANVIPAIRATRIDPLLALRQD